MPYLVDILRTTTHLHHVHEELGPVQPAQVVAVVLASDRLRRVVDANQASPSPGNGTVDKDRLFCESPT